jgi:diaminopimelate decarboxylase
MKPLGPIPAGYQAIDGVLVIDGHKATDLAADGTPLFVYSASLIRERVASLRQALPKRLGLHYAVKANSYRPILELFASLVDGFDIASGGELEMLLTAGIDPAIVSFAGPGKRDRELEAAIAAGATLNLESEAEADRALRIAERIGKTPRLAIRVNPDFDLKGSGMKMGGGAKPFGIDAERVPALARLIFASGAEWRGFHIFAGSQALDAEAIVDTQRQTFDLAARLARESGAPLPHCNLGGGFGIPYFPGDTPVDTARVGEALEVQFSALPDELAETEFCIELGRHLVGEAGVYLCRVVDRKVSHGEVFLVTDGGLHHQLAASGNFGTVVRRNYPVAVATRFAEVGDLIAVFCAGAYGASASPATFLGQGPAREILV